MKTTYKNTKNVYIRLCKGLSDKFEIYAFYHLRNKDDEFIDQSDGFLGVFTSFKTLIGRINSTFLGENYKLEIASWDTNLDPLQKEIKKINTKNVELTQDRGGYDLVEYCLECPQLLPEHLQKKLGKYTNYYKN